MIIIIYLALVIWLTVAAEKYNVNSTVVMLVSLFLSPLIGLIVLGSSTKSDKVTVMMKKGLTEMYLSQVSKGVTFIGYDTIQDMYFKSRKGYTAKDFYESKKEALQQLHCK